MPDEIAETARLMRVVEALTAEFVRQDVIDVLADGRLDLTALARVAITRGGWRQCGGLQKEGCLVEHAGGFAFRRSGQREASNEMATSRLAGCGLPHSTRL